MYSQECTKSNIKASSSNNSSGEAVNSSSSKKGKRVVIELSDSDDDQDSSNGEQKEVQSESDEDQSDKSHAWWLLKAIPKKLTKGEETKWNLAQYVYYYLTSFFIKNYIPNDFRHCKGRSQLYHTLLHYKFRLLLKIRERLVENRRTFCDSSSGTASINKTSVFNQNDILNLAEDWKFIKQETQRFENLLRQASSKWGSTREEKQVISVSQIIFVVIIVGLWSYPCCLSILFYRIFGMMLVMVH